MPAKSKDELIQIQKFYSDVEADKVIEIDNGEHISNVLDSADTLKWYDCDDDMVAISKSYPHLTFLLEGEGREDEVDVWRCYYKNGKSLHQNAELRFDDPDLSLLD